MIAIPSTASTRRKWACMSLRSLAPALLSVILAGAALAQDAAEPPAIAGRIARLSGDVSMLRAGDPDWTTAAINEPVTVGDAVYAQDDGDARLQIGATDIDLLSASEIDVAALDDQTGRLRLDTGSADLRVSALPTADGLFIETPRGTVRLTRPGIYRIDTGSEDQPTRVTAWTGAAQLGDATSVNVQPGQTLIINGTADAPQYSYAPISVDYPAEWRQPSRAVSQDRHYVSAEMTGSEDLYQYGAFQTDPSYGTVWYPADVPPDWEPYRYGHWEYVAPWGQTWIDDQPWGFAPFHYGRWARFGDRWGWCPGEYDPHPVYAPALVAFVGGAGFGVSIGFGGGEAVGWVPLGPGEIYRPPYRVSENYVANVNRTLIINKTVINRTTIINDYKGAPRNPGAFANSRFATVAPADIVARGRPVSQAVLKTPPQALEHATVNQQVITDIRRGAAAERPAARPGPVRPPAAGGEAVAGRPQLPPAAEPHGNPAPRPGPITPPGRPNGAVERLPPAPPPPRGNPGERPAGQPDHLRPETGRPEAARPAVREDRPTAPDRVLPERPAPARPAPQRPAAEPPSMEMRGQPQRELRTEPHPAEGPRAERPAPQPRPAPQARAEPQARPEPRPAEARPPQPPAARPAPAPKAPPKEPNER